MSATVRGSLRNYELRGGGNLARGRDLLQELERGGGASPSLSIGHISNEGAPILSASQRKVAFAIEENVRRIIGVRPAPLLALRLNSTGFLTLTVGDRIGGGWVGVHDFAEASRRVNSLRVRVLSDLFLCACIVSERHKSGAIHFHLVGALRSGANIRKGFDHAAVARRDYRTVSGELRAIWKALRDVLPGYGFGRAELTPIRTTGEAIACYLAKYVGKHVGNRRAEDVGKKLVRYIGMQGAHLKASDFGWASAGAGAWRRAMAMIGQRLGVAWPDYGRAESDGLFAELIGPRWAYLLTRILAGAGWTVESTGAEIETAMPLVIPAVLDVCDSRALARLAKKNFSDRVRPYDQRQHVQIPLIEERNRANAKRKRRAKN